MKKKIKLDKLEKEIEKSLASGEWQSLPKSEVSRFEKMAKRSAEHRKREARPVRPALAGKENLLFTVENCSFYNEQCRIMNSMKGRYLLKSVKPRESEADIFGDKSALVLHWLLSNALDKEPFSLRLAAKESGVSLGQAQKVFATLIHRGILGAQGERTAKKFIFKKPAALLKEWEEKYSLVNKVKLRTYRTPLFSAKEILKRVAGSNLKKYIVLGLHSAARAKGFSNTNLESVEIYLLDPKKRLELEKLLELEPQERGYGVLIAEPYYKNWLKRIDHDGGLAVSPDLLTYLDLANYPLRGREQADYLLQKSPELKRIRNAK